VYRPVAVYKLGPISRLGIKYFGVSIGLYLGSVFCLDGATPLRLHRAAKVQGLGQRHHLITIFKERSLLITHFPNYQLLILTTELYRINMCHKIQCRILIVLKLDPDLCCIKGNLNRFIYCHVVQNVVDSFIVTLHKI
jgi:hypothetical protein